MRPQPDKKGVRHHDYDCCQRPHLAGILPAKHRRRYRPAALSIGCSPDRGFVQTVCRPAGLYLHGQDHHLFRDGEHVLGHRRMAAVARTSEGRSGCGDDAKHPADAGDDGGRAARRLHGGQCQPALYAARTRTPAQGFGRQGDHHPGELRRHPAAGHFQNRRQACLRGDHGRPAGTEGGTWSTSLSARSRNWFRPGRYPAMSASRRRCPPARARRSRLLRPLPKMWRSCNTPEAPPAYRRARR